MPRLPQVGGDEGSWGTVLNDFLLSTHTPNGDLKDNIVQTNTISNAAVTEAKLSAPVVAKINSKISGEGVTSIVPITRSAYDALSTHNASTLYIINETL